MGHDDVATRVGNLVWAHQFREVGRFLPVVWENDAGSWRNYLTTWCLIGYEVVRS